MEAIGGHGVACVRPRHRSPHQHRPLAHAPPDSIMWYELRPSTRRHTAWKPVRPATAWIRLVSGASARMISGHMVLLRHPQYVV
jgi:hypothetical protein